MSGPESLQEELLATGSGVAADIAVGRVCCMLDVHPAIHIPATRIARMKVIVLVIFSVVGCVAFNGFCFVIP